MKISKNIREEKYVDFDEDTALWCVFGVDSGFAYASFADKDSAQLWLNNHEK